MVPCVVYIHSLLHVCMVISNPQRDEPGRRRWEGGGGGGGSNKHPSTYVRTNAAQDAYFYVQCQ